MIRVLVVEDSLTVASYMEWIFNQQPDMEVIGKVINGKEAVNFVKRDKPDVVTMDIEMPVMNGLEATRQIMELCPVPIVIVTASRNARETLMTMEALAAGALTLLEKPRGLNSPGGSSEIAELVMQVRLMAGVKVITRWKTLSVSPPKVPIEWAISKEIDVSKTLRIVVIGVSTGGPAALQEILSPLDKNFPYPIVIVQHIALGFIEGMINWLSGILKIPVKIGKDGEIVQAGTVYFAPDAYHLTVTMSGILKLKKNSGDPFCPSVSRLFRSVYESYGRHCLAILLTGMGNDGALEMKLLHDAGAFTIAQHKDSALIYGMPAEAVKLNGVTKLLRTNEISEFLLKLESV
jgi:two-component system, chemotaxis family, protein-glutamate methylesterase/glutaminase